MKVLIAEDAPVTRAMLVGALRRLGHDVVLDDAGDGWPRALSPNPDAGA